MEVVSGEWERRLGLVRRDRLVLWMFISHFPSDLQGPLGLQPSQEHVRGAAQIAAQPAAPVDERLGGREARHVAENVAGNLAKT